MKKSTSRSGLAWNKQDLGALHKSKIFNNYNTKCIDNPWYLGLSNAFVNAYDYYDTSDKKLLHSFQKTRDIGDFNPNFYDRKLKHYLPRKAVLNQWIDYPNLAQPRKVVGVGLRRIRSTSVKKSRKLPKLKTTAPIKEPECIIDPLRSYVGGRKTLPDLPQWIGIRSDLAPVHYKVSLRSRNEPINCWIGIPFTMDTFHQIKNFEITDYMLFNLLKSKAEYVDMGKYTVARNAMIHNFRPERKNCDCPDCVKATKMRNVIEATTNWLGFTNQTASKQSRVDMIEALCGKEKFYEYFSLEEPTKIIVVNQLSKSAKVNIGISGEPVSHTLDDFTIVSELPLENPFQLHPEYNKKGREFVETSPNCSGSRVPLSWDDQLSMETKGDIKVLVGHGKDIKRPIEITPTNLVADEKTAFYVKKYLPKHPIISDKSILEIRDWFSFCKLTRALVRSHPHFTYITCNEAMQKGDISKREPVTDEEFQGYKEELLKH